MMRRLKTRGAAVAALLLATTVLASCGGDDSDDGASSAEPGKPEKASITVGVLPLADLAPFYIAIDDGMFKAEGLKVTPKQASAGAAQIAQTVSGDVDIAFSNHVSIVQAAQEGVPLRILRENNRAGPQGIYAMPDSGIEEPADLAGKRIAINSVKNIQELTARAVLDSHGVDPESLKFLELPPPEALGALEQGDVDAAWLVEPFLTQAERTVDATRVVSAFEGPTENLPVAGWTATEQFIQENPNTAAAFVRAMDAAMRKAVAEPKAVAEIIPTYTEIAPELAKQLTKPGLAERSDLSDLNQLQDLMLKYEILDEGVDLNEVVVASDELPQD
jgi:NitT/TauT family transport system substrate-binding protein